MKSRLSSLLLSLLVLLPATLHASTTAPLFAGNTLTILGETYTWTSATEDSEWHYDTYTFINAASETQSMYTIGLIAQPSLANVTGSTPTESVSGYISDGTYFDNYRTFSDSGTWTVNGVTYTHLSRVDNDYVNWFSDGGTLRPEIISTGTEDYTGPDGNLHRWWNTSVSGSYEIHSTFSGGTTPACGQSQFTVFGITYQFQEATSFNDDFYDSSNVGTTDKYTSLEAGNLQVKSVTTNGSTTYSITAWDPHLGTMTSNAVTSMPGSSLTGITWKARFAPTFARTQLWLDGKLLNWQSSTINTAGLVTDSYSGSGLTLTVSALAHDYFAGGDATATITSAGGGTGTLEHDGTFTLSGHVLQNASPNHSAPVFAVKKTLLRVSGTNYSFIGGFQDSQGNRTDVYANPSYGMVTFSGSAFNPVSSTVRVSKNGVISTGTFYDGSFTTSSTGVTFPGNQPLIYGPTAFWVRGEFYLQNTTTPTSYASAAGHTLTLTGTSTWTLAGSDATGAFSGTCSNDPLGIFMLQALDESSQPIADSMVPVLPANADGTLHLSWETLSDAPPAILDANGRTLVYVGMATDDTDSTGFVVYYASATASDQSDWLLKLRSSSDDYFTATYIDYSHSPVLRTTGSYSKQTHLFQTSAPAAAPAVSFPLPMYGVDPTANFALWGLTEPTTASGLPATFLVQGNVWRYTGTDSNGTATYLGYYSNPETGSQFMTVAAPDADGARVVTVTDPFHGDGSPTQGTLNDVRGSVRLRDGSEIYSGSFSGQQINPTLNDHNLHTIAADLDITGNIITFGSLTGNAATAGVTLQFADSADTDGAFTGSFYSMLARPQAQWVWARTVSTSSQSTLPVMKLDASHKLTLYDNPATGQTQNAGIVLDPKPDGVSTIRGTLRVRPGGDIDMGEFTGTPPGMSAP